MRTPRLAFVGLLVIAGCVTFAYREAVSPRATLYAISRAIDNHDYAAFARHVDAEAIAQQIDATMPRTIPRQPGAPMVMVAIPAGVFAPQFVEQMRRYVETGDAAPRVRDLLDLLRGHGAETAITGIAEQPDGSQIVMLRHEFKRSEITTDVRLVMRKDGALWKLEKIENLPSIMAALDQFEVARLRVENRDKKVVLRDMLSITNGRMTTADPAPQFSFTAENHGADTIERARLRLTARLDNEIVAYGDFWMTLHLAPGERRLFTTGRDTLLRSWSRREPLDRWTVTFEPLGISTTNGKIIELQPGPTGIPE